MFLGDGMGIGVMGLSFFLYIVVFECGDFFSL